MLFTRSGKYLAWLQIDSREADTVKSWPLFLFVSLSLPAIGQSSAGTPQDRQAGHVQLYTSLEQEPDDLRQELDADAAALSKIPADPLLQPDPLGFLFKPIDHLTDRTGQSERLKLSATYTFLNQYATTTLGSIRHNQPSGRLDFSAVWVAYDHESTAGSISVLVRSGTNIGLSQQFNLSDSLGSGLFLNCLQGGARRSPSHSTSSTGGKIY